VLITVKNQSVFTCPSLILNSDIIPGAKTLVFDRDGTINIDTGYVHEVSDFAFMPEFLSVLEILAQFNGNICIVTNQGGASIGKYLESESRKFTDHLISSVQDFGVKIKLVATCYHHNLDKCEYRKPAPGMLREIQRIVKSDLTEYLYIGNDWKDLEVARDCNVGYLDIKSDNFERKLLDWINLR
jgi:D-glycero-D-manno-heptose 1,7-bisphosphate phosphatase